MAATSVHSLPSFSSLGFRREPLETSGTKSSEIHRGRKEVTVKCLRHSHRNLYVSYDV